MKSAGRVWLSTRLFYSSSFGLRYQKKFRLRETFAAGPIGQVDAVADSSPVDLVWEAARRKDVTRFHFVQRA